ncbi:MAG TPA: hypothetical protein VLB76_03670 [Thermoanaerobaculia bacterium]|jgi:hypothetical protein|nr:hypothetical protein [Thermoanaerobaculia bacterium]
MTRKLILVLAMLVLTGLADAAKPKLALACSGDDCGCGEDAIACHDECVATYAITDPAYQACVHNCIVANKNCSIACCA